MFLRPSVGEVVNFLGAKAGDDILGDAIKLYEIEERSRCAELLERKLEFLIWLGGVRAAPVLEIGVGKVEEILDDGDGVVAFLLVISCAKLRIQTFGELAAVAVIEFLQVGEMAILGGFPAKSIEKL